MSSATPVASSAASIHSVTATIKGTVGQILATTLAAPAPTKQASESILDPSAHAPTVYNPSSPITLFIIQMTIIVSLSAFLGVFLKKLRQPRVIAEVIGGILLGPTAMGRVPGFTDNIFPKASIPNLNLVANLGLVLYLFIIGLETDVEIVKRNWKAAAGVGFVGLAIPFGLGAAIAKGLYDRFVDSNDVEFGHFLLFICVAFGITAFPVLCRILTELKLMHTNVGITTLAAGVLNDVVGWILLALAVALANAGAGLTALYVLLVIIGWVLFLIILVRPAFVWLVRRSGSFETGPTQGIMCLTLLMMFASAFFTQVIGVHAIFGAFLVGVIMPHEAGFAEQLTEKIEDLVSVLLLPLYFALSGLSTDLGLLNNSSIWGWCFAVMITAEVAKFVPCFLMSLAMGNDWRESGGVGSLMACKGLVELIVLNIGLNAGVLNPPVFAMFVLMALVTTFATTPLTLMFYPESYRLAKAERLRAEADAGALPRHPEPHTKDGEFRSRFLVVLNRLEHLPSMMAFVKLLQPPVVYGGANKSEVASVLSKEDEAAGVLPSDDSVASQQRGVTIDALRLIELSARTSDVMKANENEETARADPLTNIFRTFANLNGVNITSALSIVPSESFSDEIVAVSNVKESDMVIVPWSAGISGSVSAPGAFDKIFSFGEGGRESSPQYAALVRSIFAQSVCDVALYLERGSGGAQVATAGSQPWTGEERIFFAFHGGPDDRASLDFVVQLCRHPGVRATVIRVIRSAEPTAEDEDSTDLGKRSTSDTHNSPAVLSQLTVHGGNNGIDTLYGTTTPDGRLQSDTADNLAWSKYFPSAGEEPAGLSTVVQKALTRITSSIVETTVPLQTTLKRLREFSSVPSSAPLLAVASRSRRGAESHATELVQYLKDRVVDGHGLGIASSSEVRKTLGDIGSAVVVSGLAGAVLVVQAGAAGGRKNRIV